MCSPVEHYVCFYSIFFLTMKCRMSPGKIVFGVAPSKGDKQCPRRSGLSYLYLSPVKTIIGVPGKVVCLRLLLFVVPDSLSC